MKTRQQRLAEERAGHPSSPPQALENNPRGPRRTRAKTPRATVAVGSVAPAAQLAVLEEPQALLRVWVDGARAVDDPTHTYAIPKSLLLEVMAFIEAKKTSQGRQDLPANSSESAQCSLSSPINQKSQARPPPLDLLNDAELPHNLRGKSHLPSYTTDGTALYGLVSTVEEAPGAITSSEDPQINDEAVANEASTDEDIEMDDANDDHVNQSDSSAEHLAESSAQEAIEPTPDRTPETPRGRSWGFGSLYQSARFFTNRFGFSPLTPVSERSEPTTPPTQTTRTTPTPTKKKASIPTSARATRTKSRGHSDSVAGPVKQVTNQEGQAPLGKKASPAPETSPIHRGEEEAKHGKPNQPLCWPSRSLERMLGSGKRKRWGDPITEQQPVKLRRIGDKIDFSSQQPGVRTPVPITNSAGTFKVPSPSDSDWSDSEEEERGFKVPSPSDSDWSSGDENEENVTPAVNAGDNPGPTGGQNFHAYQDWSKTATPAVVAALGGMEVDPQIAGDAFGRGLDKFNASGYIFESIPDNLQPFTPLNQYGISPRVEAYLDSQWDVEDQRAAVTEFDKAFTIFQENEAAAAAVAN